MHSFRQAGLALLAWTALSGTALAQMPTAPPPLHGTVDANGVDLVSGKLRTGITEAVIGSGEGSVPLERLWGDGGFRDNWSNGLYTSGGITYVEFGELSDAFTQSGGVYTSIKGDGATLTGGPNNWVYTASDGTQILFGNGSSNFPIQVYSCPDSSIGACAIPGQITMPNGMKFTLLWGTATKCTSQPDCDTGIEFREGSL